MPEELQELMPAVERTWEVAKNPCPSCDHTELCDPQKKRDQLARCLNSRNQVPQSSTVYCLENEDVGDYAGSNNATMIFFNIFLNEVCSEINPDPDPEADVDSDFGTEFDTSIHPDLFFSAMKMMYGMQEESTDALIALRPLFTERYREFIDMLVSQGQVAQRQLGTELFTNIAIATDASVRLREDSFHLAESLMTKNT